MTPRRWRRLGIGICAAGVLASVVVLARSRTSDLSAPVSGGCEMFLAGVPVSDGTRPNHAIQVSSAGTLVASGVDPAGTPGAEILATLAEDLPDRATWSVRRRSFDPPRQEFEVAVRMSEVAGYGIGLTLITVATDSCRASVWIEIGDRPPVFTAIGLFGFVLTAAGAVAVIVNLWRSRAGAGATFPGALGAGLPYGAGLGVLAQQAGTTPLSRPALLAWIVIGSGGAAILHLLRRNVSVWRHDRRARRTTMRQSPMRDER